MQEYTTGGKVAGFQYLFLKGKVLVFLTPNLCNHFKRKYWQTQPPDYKANCTGHWLKSLPEKVLRPCCIAMKYRTLFPCPWATPVLLGDRNNKCPVYGGWLPDSVSEKVNTTLCVQFVLILLTNANWQFIHQSRKKVSPKKWKRSFTCVCVCVCVSVFLNRNILESDKHRYTVVF